MKRRNRLSAKSLFLVISTLFALLVFSFSDVSAAPKTPTDITKPDSNLLQFKAGNHILGFASDKAYLASMDHALSVQFLGTKGVTPKADINAPATSAMTKAPSLRQVVYQNLWDGIDLTYVATKDGITESTYYVAPDADVSQISLRYNVPVEMQKDGSLKFTFDTGNLTESAPIAWQEIDGKRQAVRVAFRINDNTIGFQVGNYDRTQPLVIDPTYQWHTFYGTANVDTAYSMAIDGSGNVYVTGTSDTNWNGPAGQAPLNYHSGTNDICVLKLDSSGAYQWHTFYGSGPSDYGYGIAIDGNGNVYVTGYSGAGWNGPAGQAPLNAHSGGISHTDIFILKLNSSGAYQWHTFYGSIDAFANGIAIDGNGNVYVTGTSFVTWNGPAGQAPLNPHGYSGLCNVLSVRSV